MIFSLSSFLPWIAAAFLPWILHFFLFRKAEEVRFPSLFFLRQCYGWSTRLKLRKLILLLTRSALILYFILAALKPYVKKTSSAALSTAAMGPVLLVLDDRPAMRLKLMARSESLFDAYRQAVVDDLDRRSQAQEVSAIPLSELTVPASIRFVSPRQAAGRIRQAALQAMEPPVEQNLRMALERFSGRLLFFSPFQLGLQDPRLERLGPALPYEPNWTISSLKVPAHASAGQPVSVQASVVDGYGRPAEAMVRLALDGQDVAVSSAELGLASFLLTSLTPGRHVLLAQLVHAGTDGYADDDRRIAQIGVSPDPTVGFAAKTFSKAMEAALLAFAQPEGPAVRLSAVSDWETKNRVVVLNMSPAFPDAIQKGLARGMEIVLFADALESDAGRVSASGAPSAGVSDAGHGPAELTSIASGVLQNIWNLDGSSPTPSSLGFSSFSSENRLVSLERKIKLLPQPRDEVSAYFTDGSPAVIRRIVGAGSVLLVAFSAADPGFQADPAFLLMVRELLSNRQKTDPAFVFADVPLRSGAAISMGPAAPAGTVRLVNKTSATALSLGYANGRFFAEMPPSPPPPGIYRLLIGDEEKGSVHLYTPAPPPLAMPRQMEGARVRIEFDSFFFWMAVLLMAVELLLLRHIRITGPSRAS